jgi:alpha-tubulin suppressor-like RCC1 family protein
MPKRYAGGIITATFKPLDPHGDNNSLYVWGDGFHGEMGLNDRYISRSSPVQVGSDVTWSKVFGTATANWRLAIKQNGTLWAWGVNGNGQLGQNNTSNRSSPTQIGALTTWATGTVGGVSGGSTAAIKTDGTLWTWGKNDFGELGNNNVAARSSPVQVGSTPQAADSWSTADGASADRMGIRTDGSLWLWGPPGYGKIGDDTSINRSSPVQIGTLTTWAKVAGLTDHSLAIKTDGSLWAWGGNANNGGRGFGSVGDNTSINRSSPVQIGADTNWSKIAASLSHSMAIKTDGTMWSWGRNDAGNFLGVLGDNTTISRSSPVQVGSLTTWSLVSCGRYHTLAVKTDGTMWSWGRSTGGPLGLNTPSIASVSSPTQIGSDTNWSQISGAGVHSMAIKTDGTLWLWGSNAYGRLGTNDIINRSSPVQVGALTSWSKISGGNEHSLALKNDGTLWAWGTNDPYGQVGDNTIVQRSSPVQVGTLNTWAQVIGGDQSNSNAIETDGSWYSWGRNFGELGDNTQINKSSPVQVGSEVYGWSLVSRGGYVSAAIRADGTLWAWGRNQVGQLGQNNTVLRSSPVQVGTDTNWSKVSVAANSILAIKTDNSLWVWGYQDQGVLGLNDTVPRSSPVQVGATNVWSLISATRYHAGAIKTDGTLWTWGQSSNHGQLGLGDRDNRSSPVQLGSDTNWSQVSAGHNTTAAVKTIGTLYVWGDGRHGEMDNNSAATSRSSPIQVGSLTTWADVSVGSDDSAQAIFAISSIPF